MEDIDKMEQLRLIVEGEDDDATLRAYLGQAGHAILNRLYPYMSEQEFENAKVPARYSAKQIKIAAYLMNKRGAEGEIQHIENGIHRNYGNADIPSAMLNDIPPFIGIPR